MCKYVSAGIAYWMSMLGQLDLSHFPKISSSQFVHSLTRNPYYVFLFKISYKTFWVMQKFCHPNTQDTSFLNFEVWTTLSMLYCFLANERKTSSNVVCWTEYSSMKLENCPNLMSSMM